MLDDLLELIRQTWIFGVLLIISAVAWLAGKNFTPLTSLMTKYGERDRVRETVIAPSPSPLTAPLTDSLPQPSDTPNTTATSNTDTSVLPSPDPSLSPLPHFSVTGVRGGDDDFER